VKNAHCAAAFLYRLARARVAMRDGRTLAQKARKNLLGA
jgi:hypothetical protein